MLDISKISETKLLQIAEMIEGKIKDVKDMSVEEAFDAYLRYHGIIGYTTQIMNTLKQLQEAKCP